MPALSSTQRRTVHALAATLLPGTEGEAPGASDLDLAARIDVQLDGYNRGTLRMVRGMITAFDIMGVASRAGRPFHRMSDPQRRQFLDGVETGRLSLRRDLLVGLKALISLAYFSAPEVAARIGYDGLPLVPVESEKASSKLPVTSWPDLADGAADAADVVIVGTGAGGAVCAYELARAGHSVILVEEGGAFERTDFADQPLLDRLGSAYRDQGLTFTTGNVTISLPLGRAVGGTTVVNSGTCFRAPEWVLESWVRDYGVAGTDAESMAPYFDEVERILNVTPVPDHLLGKNGEMLRRGAGALGWNGGPIPRNIRGCHGSGECAFGCPRDAKQSMQLSYLPLAVRHGARIFAHCRARRVRHDGVRATGVEVAIIDPESGEERGTLELRASTVVVAAGAVFSPLLLGRSGLGGISRQVGRNLRIHPGAGAMALFDEDLRAWRGTMQSYHVDHRLKSDGIILEATMPPPGISYSAGALPFYGERLMRHVADYPRMASVGMMVSDRSSGRVYRRPDGRPLMLYNLGRDETRRMAEAVIMAGELYFAAGAREFYPVLHGMPVVHNLEELRTIDPYRVRASDFKLSAYHPMGTVRMGSDPRRAAVDSDGRSFACEGLYVCDASLFPSSTAVNPQLTIMATAHRVGRRLAERLSG